MRKLIILAFNLIYVQLFGQTLIDSIVGKYECSYIIGYRGTTTTGFSTIEMKKDITDPNYLITFDTLDAHYKSNNSYDSSRILFSSLNIHRQNNSDTIILFSGIIGNPESGYVFAGDSIYSQRMYKPYWDWSGPKMVTYQKGKRVSPISITPPTYSKLKLYPQPAQNELFVSDLPQGKKVLKLFDLVGKEIWRKESELVKEVIDLSALQNGMYVLDVECDGKRFTEKVLK